MVNIIIKILSIIFLILLLASASIAIYLNSKMRKKFVKKSKGKSRDVKYAHAGEGHGCHRPSVESRTKIYGLDLIQFRDANGEVLDLDNYELFIADGNSMRLCGIKTNDLVVATKGFKPDNQTEFPVIVVLKNNNTSGSGPEYKIRRAWRFTTYIDDKTLLEEVKAILQLDRFKDLKKTPEYPGDEEILEDFEGKRLNDYHTHYPNCYNANDDNKDIIVSSTLNTDNGKIHLSIHPINKIVGKVIASYEIPKRFFNKNL